MVSLYKSAFTVASVEFIFGVNDLLNIYLWNSDYCNCHFYFTHENIDIEFEPPCLYRGSKTKINYFCSVRFPKTRKTFFLILNLNASNFKHF